jgi:aminoglycoside 2'-N-acetyltransferase I
VPHIQVLATDQVPAPVLIDVQRLVVAAFDSGFTDDDWLHALGGWHVIALEEGRPVAHAAVVPREIHVGGETLSTGYLEAVATTRVRQGTGLGSTVLQQANDVVRQRFDLGCLSTSRHGFYERLGWERWRGPSFVRTGEVLVRTADEDDGLMVLRCDRTADVDVTMPISCASRPGDDW